MDKKYVVRRENVTCVGNFHKGSIVNIVKINWEHMAQVTDGAYMDTLPLRELIPLSQYKASEEDKMKSLTKRLDSMTIALEDTRSMSSKVTQRLEDILENYKYFLEMLNLDVEEEDVADEILMAITVLVQELW